MKKILIVLAICLLSSATFASQAPIIMTDGTGAAIITNPNSMLNQALGALASVFSGPSAPSIPVTFQRWRDTTNNITKYWDGAAWQIATDDGPVITTTTGTTLTNLSMEQIIQSNLTSTATITFPSANAVPNGSWVYIKSIGTATTIIGATVDTVINTPILQNHGMFIYTDGTSWRELRGFNSYHAVWADNLNSTPTVTLANGSSNGMVVVKADQDGTGKPIGSIQLGASVNTDGPLGFIYFLNSYGTNSFVAAINGSTNGNTDSGHIRFFTRSHSGVLTEAMIIQGSGAVTIDTLAGTGSRLVYADATGILSAETPSYAAGAGSGVWPCSSTATRVVTGNAYHNTSGHSCMITVSAYSPSAGNTLQPEVGPSAGSLAIVGYATSPASSYWVTVSFLVPVGQYYAVDNNGGSWTLGKWYEAEL